MKLRANPILTAEGLEHGLIKTYPNSIKGDGMKNFASEKREEMKKLKEQDARMIKCRYINSKGKRRCLEANYMNWAGEDILCYRLLHGFTYELPFGFLKQIEGSGLVIRSQEDGHNDKVNKEEGKESEHYLIPLNL